MYVTIHQPEYIPWLGFFDKLRQVDCFVILDDVQYTRRYFQSRNRVRSAAGAVWLRIPVHTRGRRDQAIRDVRIVNEGRGSWRDRHWRTLVHCYRKARFFADHAGFFEELYRRRWTHLAEFNVAIIRYLMDALGLHARLVHASELGRIEKKGQLMLAICQALGATRYLAGISGRDYLDPEAFRAANIHLEFQHFFHPIYAQCHAPFMPCMAAVDLLFNHGPRAGEILCGEGIPRMDHVFE